MIDRMGPGHFLVVDDNRMNRIKLARGLEEQGHTVGMAEDGRQALGMLRAEAFDVVLLDIVMPEVDGYEVLAQVKGDAALRDIPIIVISAVDEMESVVRCIEMGATDYLPKPFNAALLQARINASLAAKRLRDLELEYLEQVNRVMHAAGAVESGSFEIDSLDQVAARGDALGSLARVFQRMAREVYTREQRLKQQIQELRIEIDEARQATKVAEIVESDYFRNLRQQAEGLRQIMADEPPAHPPRPSDAP
jgi:DNA-binding response OmpR family regulator